MYYKNLVFEPHLNLVLVGSKDVIKMFRTRAGKSFNAIDLPLNIKDFIINIIRFIDNQTPLKSIPEKKL